MEIRLFDTPTATTLAQILPVLLLTVMVEIRRLELHRRGKNIVTTRVLLGTFFGLFAIVETVLVLSIDGHLFPFQWSDCIAAVLIFALLVMLFIFSMMGAEPKRK
ncbi:hypothetical protein [Lacisediminihabitans changchengi]|uniref:Uncharacterized protein n=1 Tax=Lacisediminihabitans changchengi TaxID=2787634 RepID=A0A934SJN6_9MICO|nr:hypothetical protein [Lacisediminihabitans changchengi]MBK4346122.1 hypothetical protein [Lacisediminihabitans changchengi]